jgi:hypothetical protein
MSHSLRAGCAAFAVALSTVLPMPSALAAPPVAYQDAHASIGIAFDGFTGAVTYVPPTTNTDPTKGMYSVPSSWSCTNSESSEPSVWVYRFSCTPSAPTAWRCSEVYVHSSYFGSGGNSMTTGLGMSTCGAAWVTCSPDRHGYAYSDFCVDHELGAPLDVLTCELRIQSLYAVSPLGMDRSVNCRTYYDRA